MNPEQIQHEKQAIVERFGEWTAHNIYLASGVYTIGNQIVGDEVKLRRITQLVVDIAKKPLQELRVLDLACLEGLYGMELARHGAEVVGIEGREANLAKAQFTKKVLDLDHLTLIQDDVRNLNVEQHGYFDVVLCLGILYHLEVPDIFLFLEHLSQVCQGFAVIDTHVSVVAERSHTHNGNTYWGASYQEHAPESNLDERAQDLWASLDNVTSFWFTRPSLYNILSHLGFTSIYECHYPSEVGKPSDRITLLAIKGQPQPLHSAPLMADQSIPPLPELSNPPIQSGLQPPIHEAPSHKFSMRSLMQRLKVLLNG
ncbi:class I SAM-dependent methyltransferase [Leptolyngbyaceae cyanobacterium UHCC 1019]